MIRLVRAILRHTDIVGLCSGELRELGTDFFEVETSNFFVEVLRQHGDLASFVGILVLP